MGYQPDILNDIVKKLKIPELKRILILDSRDKNKIKEIIEDRICKYESEVNENEQRN